MCPASTKAALRCVSALTVAISACGESGLSYEKDVEPIMDARCVGCHTLGGIAPFSLERYEDVRPMRDFIRHEVSERTMPPWPASGDCADYAGDPSLTDEEIDTIVQWVDQGSPRGEEQGSRPTAARREGAGLRIDRSLAMPGEYTPTLRPDDSRCFRLDWPEETARYLTGFQVTPGDRSLVHHVLIFKLPASAADDYQAFEDEDPELGWTCFGGPSNHSDIRANVLGGWAPGVGPQRFPEGSGLRVEPDAIVILQIHYSTLSAEPGPDLTTVDVELEDSVVQEGRVLRWTNLPWIAGEMNIPAGDPEVVHSFSGDPGELLPYDHFRIHSTALHMHLLGTSGRLQIDRADGSHQCLLDIPRWDWSWQFVYWSSTPVDFQRGDLLGIECRWDNSAENQPIVDGLPRPPRDVSWGQTTADEMCLGLAYVTEL